MKIVTTIFLNTVGGLHTANIVYLILFIYFIFENRVLKFYLTCIHSCKNGGSYKEFCNYTSTLIVIPFWSQENFS